MVRKIAFERELANFHHRCGWSYAQQCLKSLIATDAPAVMLDTMIERNFARELEAATEDRRIPYLRPWAGFCHTPFGLPAWSDHRRCPATLFQLAQFRESLPYCRGLITLTESLAAEIRELLPGIPVISLYHPTELDVPRWSYTQYAGAGEPVVQLGWWLRRYSSIHFLPLDASRKRLLLPFVPDGLERYWKALEGERRERGAPPFDRWSVTVIPRLSNGDYDALLTRSVIFQDLANAAANNTVVECMARATPILVNRRPALEQYLGEDYPLFYESLDEAAGFARDRDRVVAAHEYLSARDLSFLSGENFVRGLAESGMYRNW